MSRVVAAAFVAVVACTPTQGGSPAVARRTEDAGSGGGAVASGAVASGAGTGAGAGTGTDAGEDAAAGTTEDVDAAEGERTFGEIGQVLFADRSSLPAACGPSIPPDARVRCLYDERYEGDAKAASLAHEMWVKWRIVAGVEVAHTMDGGYRGPIQLVPAVPIGDDRKHLEWAVAAFSDFAAFFTELDAYGRAHDARSPKKPYRFRGIEYRFAKSVNVNRPSAYAHDWVIGYNLRGSINLNADMVRETLFHEIFHLNDPVHGEGGGRWSTAALSKVFDAIVKRCGTTTSCLRPYTPNETMVRGGTYYSFQPGNGVVEYAAELALRYYREQRAALRALPSPSSTARAFKCGPKENAEAWAAMKDEFFRGIDATPPCP